MIEYFTPDYDKLIKVADPDDSQAAGVLRAEQAPVHRAGAPQGQPAAADARRGAVAHHGHRRGDQGGLRGGQGQPTTFPRSAASPQLTFPDKAAADKAYAELSKAKNFEEAAAKLGFPAADIDLGLLTRPEMIDPKIADAAFALKKDELSQPVEGQFSVALLRVSEIEAGKQRTFDEVKGEIKDRIADERVGQKLQELHDEGRDRPRQGQAAQGDRRAAQAAVPRDCRDRPPRQDRRRQGRHRARGCRTHRGGRSSRRARASRRRPWSWPTAAMPGSTWSPITPERQKTLRGGQGGGEAPTISRPRSARRSQPLPPSRSSASQAGEGMQKRRQGARRQGRDAPSPFKRSATPPGLPHGRRAAGLRRLPRARPPRSPTPDGKARVILRVADIIAAPAADARADRSPEGRARQADAHRPAGTVRRRPADALRLHHQRGAAASRRWDRRPSSRRTPATTDGRRALGPGRTRTHDEAGHRPSRFRSRAGAQRLCRSAIARAARRWCGRGWSPIWKRPSRPC